VTLRRAELIRLKRKTGDLHCSTFQLTHTTRSRPERNASSRERFCLLSIHCS